MFKNILAWFGFDFDSGWRVCTVSEHCTVTDCSHAMPHKQNTGCVNVCLHSEMVCAHITKPK